MLGDSSRFHSNRLCLLVAARQGMKIGVPVCRERGTSPSPRVVYDRATFAVPRAPTRGGRRRLSGPAEFVVFDTAAGGLQTRLYGVFRFDRDVGRFAGLSALSLPAIDGWGTH